MRAAAACALLALSACAAGGPHEMVAFAPVCARDDAVALRVAVVEDPAFPPLTEAFLDAVLAQAQSNARRYLRKDVSFAYDRRTPEYFHGFLNMEMTQEAYDLVLGAGVDRYAEKLSEILRRKLQEDRARILPLINFYLGIDGIEALADDEIIARTLRYAQDVVDQVKASPIFHLYDDLKYSGEASNTAGTRAIPYNIVMLNYPLIDVNTFRFYTPDPHIFLRGGLLQGIAWLNAGTPCNDFVALSAFPYYKYFSFMNTLDLTEAEFGALVAKNIAHEIGHSLMHLGHPFGNPDCIMNTSEINGARFIRDFPAYEDCPIVDDPADPMGIGFFSDVFAVERRHLGVR